MNYNTDIIVGLQNLKEGKTKILKKLLNESHYDLCIKINGGTETSYIKYNDELILLKEIPYSILYNIDTYISESCLVNLDDLKEDIEKLKHLNISLKKLFISNNTSIITNKNIIENKQKHIINYKYKNLNTLRDKYSNNNLLKIKDLTSVEYYYFLMKNSVTRVDSYDFFKNYKKILAYQFLSFNNDIDFGNNIVNSGFHCSSSFCFNIINFKSLSNIFGVCCVYEIFEDYKLHNEELDIILSYDSPLLYYDWLDLNTLIKNINLNNINILYFTKTDILNKINIFKIKYNNNIHNFDSIELFKFFIKEKINLECNISYVNFLSNY